jgi:hypothetical protein
MMVRKETIFILHTAADPVPSGPGVCASLPLLSLHRLPLNKEHPLQPAFAERVAGDAEGEKRNEHQ